MINNNHNSSTVLPNLCIINNRLCHTKNKKIVVAIEEAFNILYDHHICNNKKKTTEKLFLYDMPRTAIDLFQQLCPMCRKNNWNATKRYEAFTIDHDFDGGCKLAEAFHSLIHKYDINLLDGSIVFTMPKETAMKLKKDNQDSKRFQGLKPLFPGSLLYTDGARKQYVLMDTQQPYDYPKKKQWKTSAATGGDLQYHHKITFDVLYIALIKRVELELQIITGCFDYSLRNVVFLNTHGNDGIRQNLHYDWNQSTPIMTTTKDGKKKTMKPFPKFFIVLAIDDNQSLHVREDNGNLLECIFDKNDGIIAREDQAHAGSVKAGTRLHAMFLHNDAIEGEPSVQKINWVISDRM